MTSEQEVLPIRTTNRTLTDRYQTVAQVSCSSSLLLRYSSLRLLLSLWLVGNGPTGPHHPVPQTAPHYLAPNGKTSLPVSKQAWAFYDLGPQ